MPFIGMFIKFDYWAGLSKMLEKGELKELNSRSEDFIAETLMSGYVAFRKNVAVLIGEN